MRRLTPYLAVLALVVSLNAAAIAQQSAQQSAQQKLLTIDDLYDAQKRVNFSGTVPQLRWLPGGTHYLQTKIDPATREPQLLKVEVATGGVTPFNDATRIAAGFAKLPGMTSDEAKRFARGDNWQNNPTNTAFFVATPKGIFLYDLGTNEARQLTQFPADEDVAAWSPDGTHIAFVRDHNLYALNLQTNQSRQLTTDGTPQIFNGVFNWVYQEELYGRGNFKAFWWSPDSKQIAFLRLDDAPVPSFPVVDHIPVDPNVETTPYPKAGDPNPLVKLGVVNIASGAARFIETSQYKPEDFLISRVEWTPDGKIVFQAQDREQHFIDLTYADPATGKTTIVFREGDSKTQPWVEVIDNPKWLKDNSFIWQSDRTGYRHLYHYTADGKLIKQITKGEWDVRDLHGVDEARKLIYFSGMEHSPIAAHSYRINLDGSNQTRLTTTEGAHNTNFNDSFTHYVDFTSDINTPTQTRLFTSDGKLVRAVEENKVAALSQYKLGKVEFLNVKARDGYQLEAMMIRPPDFDSTKKYPVWSHTYSGPQAPTVRNSWGGANYLWHQMLAQKGYIVWICDNRSASGKGVGAAWTSNRNFGEGELRDLEDGIAYLKTQPYVDGSRIGLWGWSYGGFMTSYALTHSKTFKIGIAGGSVTDWRLYDSIYTERYMGTPQTNPEGYKRSSVIAAAPNLSGKLLLLHGTLDDNVHMQNTIQFAYALQKANKPFDLMLYPKSRHGVVDPALVKHMRSLMTEFIEKNL